MKKFILFAVAMALTSCATTEEKAVEVKKNRPSSGFVTLKFDVNQEGRAENIRVVEENPAGVFSKAAVKQLESRRFHKSEKGEKPPFKDGELRLDFVEQK